MEGSNRRNKSIFWAEDDEDDMFVFLEVLTEIAPGSIVVQFGNGKLLLEKLKEQEQENFPCLIILDLNMPVMDGRETLKRLKAEEKYKDIPVVVFTTSNNALDQLFCESLHTEMLVKPLQYASVKKVLEKVVVYCDDK